MARTVTRSVELGGVSLTAGDRLAVHFYSADRDPARFERPDELWFDRPHKPSAAFGLGVHRCLGQSFARIQLEIAFEELLARATNFHLNPDHEIRRQVGVGLNTPHELHLRFDTR